MSAYFLIVFLEQATLSGLLFSTGLLEGLSDEHLRILQKGILAVYSHVKLSSISATLYEVRKLSSLNCKKGAC